MPDTQPGVDAVVVSYKTSGDLDAFLRSFNDNLPEAPWDLWVVNIEPEEADREVAQRWADKLGDHAHLVEYGFNCGYAHAVNNAALAGTRETFVAFNADIVLSDGAIDRCHEALQANDDWGILGPRQVNREGRITHAGIFGTLNKPEHRGWRAHDVGQYTDTVPTAISVSGSAYFVKRTVWEELHNCPKYRQLIPDARGAFLPTVLFYEETWCSVHAISHGHRVVFFGEQTIIHEWHQAVRSAGVEHWAAGVMKESHELYRAACASHGIPSD